MKSTARPKEIKGLNKIVSIYCGITFKRLFLTLLSLVFVLIVANLFFQPRAKNTQNALKGLENCSQVTIKTKYISCAKNYLQPLIAKSGPGAVLNDIKSSSLSTPYNLKNDIDCHDFAHILGSVAGENTRDIATTLEQCGEDCYSGCYHGFFEGVQKNIDYKYSNLDDTCLKMSVGDDNKISGCLHALGHYYMELSSNRLVEGFDKCLNLETTTIFQKSCLSGAFMQAEERGENRQMAHTTPDMPTPETYISFCSSFKKIVEEYCRQESGPYIYRMTSDPKVSANYCIKEALEVNIHGCLYSLGGFFQRKQLGNYAEYLVKNCNLGNQEYSLACLEGGADSAVNGGQSIESLINLCLKQKIIDSKECKSLANR